MLTSNFLKRAFAGLLVVSAVSALLFGLHYYVAKRLIFDPALPEPWRGGAIVVLGVLGLSLVAQPIAERSIRSSHARFIAWPASLWMGFAFYLLVLLAATDLLWGLSTGVARAAGATVGEGAAASALRAAAVVAIAFAAAAFSTRAGLRPPELRRVEIVLERWPIRLDGFRIVQLSDIHIGPILDREFARDLVERANALQPDLIAVTGDLVDGAVRQVRDEVAPFGDLRSRHGVYFVTGNHDHYSDIRRLVRTTWRGSGWRVLRNERVVHSARANAAFDLDRCRRPSRRLDFNDGGGEDLAEGAPGPRSRDGPSLLLAHDPSTFKRASALGGGPADLRATPTVDRSGPSGPWFVWRFLSWRAATAATANRNST